MNDVMAGRQEVKIASKEKGRKEGGIERCKEKICGEEEEKPWASDQ